MTVFDAPDREFCIVRRSTTNTPLQALTLLNDPIFVEAARKLAERVDTGGRHVARGTGWLLRSGWPQGARRTRQEQGDPAKDTRQHAGRIPDRREGRARRLLTVGALAVAIRSIPASELAAYTAVANMILNMDEVITKSERNLDGMR